MSSKYDDLTREELIRRLERKERPPSLGIFWERDRIQHDKALNDNFIALDLDENLSCGQAPFANLIIEGDNFDALRTLRMTHAGRIKCIYIDPPYNTGNRDFVYNDHYFDKEDAYRHSTWLEFMYQRLLLAKELLHDDGVIFVSIDDNELFHLGMLMTQVFGQRNFIANVIWQKVFAPKNTAMHFSDDHEYILVYAHNRDRWRPNPIPRSQKQDKSYKNPDNDPRGLWASDNLSARNPYSAGIYPITCPSGRIIPGPPKGRYWVVSEVKFKELDADNRIWWGPKGDNPPRLKRFLSEVKQGVIPQTLWTYGEVGHTQDAKKELLDILHFEDSASVFSTPKPLRLLDRILRIATQPGDLVLDFFAGSGTLAHALLKLNQEHNGGRRFILVSSTEALENDPDKNLCRDVCAERIRRAIQGYTNNKDQKIEGLGGNFAYLRTRLIDTGEVAFEWEPAQVWTALQLAHCQTVAAYNPDALFQQIDGENFTVIFLDQVHSQTLEAVNQTIQGKPNVAVYSWQATLVKQHLPADVDVRPIPQSLMERFYPNVGTTTPIMTVAHDYPEAVSDAGR